MKLKITILTDNISYNFPHAEWGFCAHLELDDKKYLFDTGFTGICATKNALIGNIDLKEIDKIILSHGHSDHTGGLEEVLKVTGNKEIVAHPDIFNKKMPIRDNKKFYNGIKFNKEYLQYNLGATFNFQKDFYQIATDLYMTGEVPFTNTHETIGEVFKIKQEDGSFLQDTFTDDNSLIIDTPKGLVILCGCAHRGIINIINYAKKKLNKKIHAVIGGIHLIGAKKERVDFTINSLKEENIEFLGLSHCTAFENIALLKETFPEKFTPAFSGSKFDFSF